MGPDRSYRRPTSRKKGRFGTIVSSLTVFL
jgi:hypothetical protein